MESVLQAKALQLKPTKPLVRDIFGHVKEETRDGKETGTVQKEYVPTSPPPSPPLPRVAHRNVDGVAMGPEDIIVSMYIFKKGKWKKFTSSWWKRPPQISKMRVMSMNVWFSTLHWKERALSLCDLIFSLSPEIVCLQEMTPRVFEMLLQHPGIQERYCISGNETHANPYGVIMLCAHHVQVFRVISLALPSHMHRRALLCPIGKGFLSTVHLESLSNHDVRLRQLHRIQERMHDGKWAMMIGDLNVDHRNPEENQSLTENGWVDLWAQLHPQDEGDTHNAGGRLDRALVNVEKVARAIERVGTTPIRKGLHISDHCGLLVDLEF